MDPWLSAQRLLRLKVLAGLKSLQHLSVEATKVTEAGVVELLKALPGIKVVF